MNGLPTELIYILIFAAVLLFQYAMKRFGPQSRQEPAQDEPVPEIPEPVEEIPAAPSVSRVAVGDFGRAKAPPIASSLLPRRRFARRSLLGTKRAVQNAVVVATILGPCRAYEPHVVGSSPGAPPSIKQAPERA